MKAHPARLGDSGVERKRGTMKPVRPWIGVLSAVLATALLGSCAGSLARMDAVTRATASAVSDLGPSRGGNPGRIQIVLASAPGGSTEKIARAMADVLDAGIISPGEAGSAVQDSRELLGLGSAIMDQAHHKALLSFVENLPPQSGRKAFLFSTSGVSRDFALRHGIDDPHTALRNRLEEKGFMIVGEFNCAGFNANSFLKYFGGMHKGRPNAEDLIRAENFARGLKEEMR